MGGAESRPQRRLCRRWDWGAGCAPGGEDTLRGPVWLTLSWSGPALTQGGLPTKKFGHAELGLRKIVCERGVSSAASPQSLRQERL